MFTVLAQFLRSFFQIFLFRVFRIRPFADHSYSSLVRFFQKLSHSLTVSYINSFIVSSVSSFLGFFPIHSQFFPKILQKLLLILYPVYSVSYSRFLHIPFSVYSISSFPVPLLSIPSFWAIQGYMRPIRLFYGYIQLKHLSIPLDYTVWIMYDLGIFLNSTK